MGKYRALIRGAYGEGNFGDDLLMLASYWLLRQAYNADEIAFIFVSHPTAAERRYVRRLIPEINIIRYEAESAAELIVWGGGTQFYSFTDLQGSTPFYRKAIAGIANPRKSYNYFVRKFFGGKYNSNQRFAALGVGVGPFVSGSPNETYSRDLFARMDFIAVRDDLSMKLCSSWNVKATLRSDLCFLPGDWWPGESCKAPARPAGRSIGIIVRDWPQERPGAAYGPAILKVAECLRKQGFNVRFITFQPDGDLEWNRILRNRSESVVGWNPERQTITEFLSEVAEFDSLISARYHGAIFGAILGKPVICIDIEPKLRLVSEFLAGLLWPQPFDEEECLSLIRRVFGEYGNLRGATAEAVDHQRQLACTMVDEFLEFAGARRAPQLEKEVAP